MADRSTILSKSNIHRVAGEPPADLGRLILEREIPSEDALVTPLVVRLAEFLVKEGLIVEKERNRIGLCIEEACLNAVAHGNKRDFKKLVRVKIYLNDLSWSIRVDDEGNGFDLSKVPSPVSEHGMWGERGRGLSLISLYMDKVVYYHNGSTLVMSKEL